MESDKLPKVTTKDEEKVIEAKVVEVLESVSLINTKRTTSGADQGGTSREPSPPGPPIYRYQAINTRHISRVYFTNKKSCLFVGVETVIFHQCTSMVMNLLFQIIISIRK